MTKLEFARKVLRRLLGGRGTSAGAPHHLDFTITTPTGILLVGWALTETSQLTVDIKLSGDAGPALRASSMRYLRHDVARSFGKGNVDTVRYGFVVFFKISDPTAPPAEVQVALSGRRFSASTRVAVNVELTEDRRQQLADHWTHISGLVFQLAGTAAAASPAGEGGRDELEFIKSALMLLSPASPKLRQLMDQHFGPLIEAVWKSRPEMSREVVRRDFGIQCAQPRVSVVVPLYGRYDFVQHQLALFADDPDWRDVELIYVVDDPEIQELVVQRATHLHPVFGVAFSVIYCGQNLGFAGANNFGASLARGEFLILMNSDVMPIRSGWVSDFIRPFSEFADAGVLGCKLLYEDGSVQHAGMTMAPYPDWGGLPVNRHPGKGLPDDHSDESAPQVVNAVTAACLAIRRSLYQQLGGLDEAYIIGDFEDSDLCLRAAAQGLKTYVVPNVVLHHLERQSQSLVSSGSWKHKLTLYNCWRHARRHLRSDSTQA